jgi:hypothetical protein
MQLIYETLKEVLGRLLQIFYARLININAKISHFKRMWFFSTKYRLPYQRGLEGCQTIFYCTFRFLDKLTLCPIRAETEKCKN